MPLYEYQCTQCKERSEVLQNLSDPPHTHCSKCGGEMKKLLSAPAIQFKGSGFYKTDYASSSSSAPASAGKTETKGDAKSDTKSESKTETKTEMKSETKSESKSE
ncbi:MAG TPA: FmdB family zinc ribbon protein [Thermoanaerobaculia bacterium]|jgi:putative FmdB family regulatory protein|nr:FmdB family zinc ribbon protein [Thermoanaerobaculia bacterium]